MSLTRCDRITRCEEDANHEGPCSFDAPLQNLIQELELWINDPALQARYSVGYWIQEELRRAKEHLGI